MVFWLIIIIGTIVTIGVTVTDIEIRREDEVMESFFIALSSTVIGAAMEYVLYHVIALLIGSLASRTHHTAISANLLLYQATHENTGLATQKEAKRKQPIIVAAVNERTTAPTVDWICPKCGCMNKAGNMFCQKCKSVPQ